MAEVLNLSESRFRALVKSGIFPRPIQHASCKRPVFNLELQQKCLDIRATGIGLSGQPVVFNRMRASRKPRTQRQAQQPTLEPRQDHAELVEALRSLGMTATSEAVDRALKEVYPNGFEGIDQGEIIRRVFLHVRAAKL